MPDIVDLEEEETQDSLRPAQPLSELVKVPDVEGCTPGIFRSIVTAAAIIWRGQKIRPNPNMIHSIVTSQPIELIQAVTSTTEFANEMYRNGVLWDPHRDVLSSRQLMALNELSNPLSGRSLTARLKAAGVTHKEYMAWKANPFFEAKLAQLTNDLLEQSRPELLVSLLQLGLDGKLDAIKYIDEISGSLSGSSANQKLIDLRKFAQTLLEIVQEEVKDIEVLKRIATRMQIASQSFNDNPVHSARQNSKNQLVEALRA